MNTKSAALLAYAMMASATAHAGTNFGSSLAAVSDLCAFQTIYPGAPTIYEAALLGDFSKVTPDLKNFAAQGLITGIAGPKTNENGALEQFAVFAQNRFVSSVTKLQLTIDTVTFVFNGKPDQISAGASDRPRDECNIKWKGQTFKFVLKTIDPQYVSFWVGKLNAMTGDAAKPAQGLSKFINNHRRYWMLVG